MFNQNQTFPFFLCPSSFPERKVFNRNQTFPFFLCPSSFPERKVFNRIHEFVDFLCPLTLFEPNAFNRNQTFPFFLCPSCFPERKVFNTECERADSVTTSFPCRSTSSPKLRQTWPISLTRVLLLLTCYPPIDAHFSSESIYNSHGEILTIDFLLSILTSRVTHVSPAATHPDPGKMSSFSLYNHQL